MQGKPKKNAEQLRALIMQEISEDPQLRSILDVTVTPTVQAAAHQPNWNFAWITAGRTLPPLRADEIAQKLQREYDLA